MQTFLVVMIVAMATLFWLNRFFPAINKILWQGTAIILKLVKAPLATQQWALKHCDTKSNNCASTCNKCTKCH